MGWFYPPVLTPDVLYISLVLCSSTMEDSQKCLVKMEANITNLRQQLQGKEDTIRQLKKTVESYQARFVDKVGCCGPLRVPLEHESLLHPLGLSHGL